MFSLEIIIQKYISMVYIGIDVGGKGGIFAMTDKRRVVLKEAIPTKRGSTEVDYTSLSNLLKTWESDPSQVQVLIEDVHSLYGMSAKSNFSFGLIKGVKIGVVTSIGYNLELVTPKNWQKVVWIEDDIVLNDKGKRDTKATSLKAATRLFPDVDFRKSERAHIPHDGVVDAALMAEYLFIKDKEVS